MQTPVRGIDHIGITVPDIEQATLFFETVFSAQIIYRSVEPDSENIDDEAQQNTLRLFPGTKIRAIRMLAMPHGPGIELFEMHGPEQHSPARPSDFGLQHFAVYVDDFKEVIDRFTAAGGEMFTEPKPLTFPAERGEGNAFCYGKTPWGSVVELISWPTPMPYEKYTSRRRWKP
ncbi:VOC family protein [Enterobacteriaceae bacterium RIT714]|uniref:VOC family protein n=1 Tax=Lelliottia sp. CFBP8978 TaxID=3096522 RepID=UPI0012AC6A7F|nr:VOC family protein [Lelliottia sp. CFBP8978]MDY1035747.1 VOC family protein [Lelliottia sp. CFBP8978]MRS88934.1 VOC family protein [Enterobacteriaceae bacterium RIT714]